MVCCHGNQLAKLTLKCTFKNSTPHHWCIKALIEANLVTDKCVSVNAHCSDRLLRDPFDQVCYCSWLEPQ